MPTDAETRSNKPPTPEPEEIIGWSAVANAGISGEMVCDLVIDRGRRTRPKTLSVLWQVRLYVDELEPFRTSWSAAATFDLDWKRLPFVASSCGDYDGTDVPKRQESYDDMIAGAEVLAAGFTFVRIDIYEIYRRPRFGEVTLYPQSGLFRMPRQT